MFIKKIDKARVLCVRYCPFKKRPTIANCMKLPALYTDRKKRFKTFSISTFHRNILTGCIFVYMILTNFYFEGRKEGSTLAQFGRSKEKRNDAKLISLALLSVSYTQ